MFPTIKKGLKVYKRALKKYAKGTVIPMRAKGLDLLDVSRNQELEIRIKIGKLKGMEEALGLTPEEIQRFEEEAGIPKKSRILS